MISRSWQDLRYAARGLRRHVLLSTVVVATLALGIGISAGVFTLINAVALRARIDKDPGSFVRVFSLYTRDQVRPGPGDTTLEDYIAFRDKARSVRDLVASTDFRPSLEDDPSETRVRLLALAFGAGTALSRMLLALRAPFRVDTHDPVAYAIAVLLFLTVTMAAMIGPARRATKVDPMVALRDE